MKFKLLAKDSFLYSTGKILPALLNFCLIFLINHYLGVQEYAYYSNIVTLATVFGGAVVAIYTQAYLRFYEEVFEVEFFLISLFSYLFFFFIFLFSISIIPPKDAFLIIVYTLIIYHFAKEVVFFQNLQKPCKVMLVDALRGVTIFLVPLIFLIIFKHEMNYFYLISSSMLFFISLYLLKIGRIMRNLNLELNAQHWKNLKKFVGFGVYLGCWILLAGVLNYIDRLFLYHFLDTLEASYYIFWYDIVFKSCVIIFIGITMTIHAKIMDSHKKGINDISDLMKTFNFLFAAIVVVMLLMIFFGFPFIFQIFENGSLRYNKILVLLIFLGAAFWQYALIFHKPLELDLRLNIMIYGVILAIFVNVFFNIILIPKLSIYGAAISTFSSSIAYIFFLNFFKIRENFDAK